MGTLSGEVDSVAGEEEVVGRGDGESVAREGSGVDNQGTGHLARDTVDVISALVYAYQGGKEGQKQQSAPPGVNGAALVRSDFETYSSGSFCVSITAATGIPKLETGPQKSGEESYKSINAHLKFLFIIKKRMVCI